MAAVGSTAGGAAALDDSTHASPAPPLRCCWTLPEGRGAGEAGAAGDALLRVPCGALLRVCVPARNKGRRLQRVLRLWTNCPSPAPSFERERFQAAPQAAPDAGRGAAVDAGVDGACGVDGDWCAELRCELPGAFQCFVQYEAVDGDGDGGDAQLGPLHAFVVEPRVRLRGEALPPHALCVQTNLTRCVGPLRRWLPSLAEPAAAGVNMVHVTPVQALGESGSAYSIADQLRLQPDLMDDDTRAAAAEGGGAAVDALLGASSAGVDSATADASTRRVECGNDDNRLSEEDEVAYDVLHRVVGAAERDLGVLCMVDVVLNHTANDTPWLDDHPEAGYTTENSPHLKAAAELDDAVLAVSAEVAAGQHAPAVTSHMRDAAAVDAAVDLVGASLRSDARWRLWQFYVLDVDAQAEALRAAVRRGELAAHVRGDVPVGRVEQAQVDALARRITERALFNDGSGDRFALQLRVPQALAELAAFLRELGALPDAGAPPDAAAAAAAASGVDGAGDAPSADSLFALVRRALDAVNLPFYERHDDDLAAAVTAIRGAARHLWLEQRRGRGFLSWRRPLVWSYFTRRPRSGAVFANNGFVWGGDAAVDFTWPYDAAQRDTLRGGVERAPGDGGCYRLRRSGVDEARVPLCTASTPYMRRELVIWGDCVKLRYGERSADSPWLWRHMTEYVQRMAAAFAAFRLDNAHGTPLHVAAAMCDAARRVRPHLWLCAELFTGSERRDAAFVARLGVNVLVREAMQAGDAAALARDVYRYGGHPVASLRPPAAAAAACAPAPLPALLCECTHDNEMTAEKFTPEHALPVAALVAAAVCAGGTTRGFDDLLPYNLSVVRERRRYRVPTSAATAAGATPTTVGAAAEPLPGGLAAARAVLQRLRVELAMRGYDEVHVDVQPLEGRDGVVTVVRAQPQTHEAVVFICRTAFDAQRRVSARRLEHVEVEGRVTGVALAARVAVPRQRAGRLRSGSEAEFDDGGERVFGNGSNDDDKGDDDDGAVPFVHDADVVNGLDSTLWMSTEDAGGLLTVSFDASRGVSRVELHAEAFTPGSVAVLRVAPIASPPVRVTQRGRERLEAALAGVGLADLAYLLYQSDAEERDRTGGARGVYDVPGHGPLAWAGVAGVELLLRGVRARNDMGHPLLANLRDGAWLLDYTVDRLRGVPSLRGVVEWMDAHFAQLRALPRGRRPQAADNALHEVHEAAVRAACARMSPFVRRRAPGSPLLRALALNSLMLTCEVPSAPLLDAPLLFLDGDAAAARAMQAAAGAAGEAHGAAAASLGSQIAFGPSLAAGQPHFSTGCFRSWGRDTCIALRGLFLATGRFADARATLLAFASVVRHGLVPNLMDGGRSPRYNARDATWWFLQALRDYCEMSSEGAAFLLHRVQRRFPSDDERDYDGDGRPLEPAQLVQTLGEVVHHVLQRHFEGIDFVEWRAGDALDRNMAAEGFHVAVRVDERTGLLYGGSEHNCGTWMDKMGESAAFGTRGRPATPRDGAPVELSALLYSVLRWLAGLPEGLLPSDRVEAPGRGAWTLAEWAGRVRASFARCYVVPLDASRDGDFGVDASLVGLRGALRDTHGCPRRWPDYQVRCNQVVALAVAPELVTEEQAQAALAVVEEHLLPDNSAATGVKTLAPSDWAYRGNYDNDDQTDASTANGFNYHQGPEWLWPFGYYLRARMRFPHPSVPRGDAAALRAWVLAAVAPHREHLLRSDTGGLPELTNEGGAPCRHSCPVQAWSASTLLDALYDLHLLDARAAAAAARGGGGAAR